MTPLEPAPLELMPTGVPGLDSLLKGGLVRGNSLLLEGPPGSGKSTLALHTLYEGALQYGEPGLIISFDEFPRQIYQECHSRGLDIESLEQKGLLRVLWTAPKRILEGFTGKNDLLDSIVRQMKIRRLVIDSVTHFKRVAESDAHLREVLGQILSYLKLRGINSVLIKELERNDDVMIAFEEYLVDASVRVYNESSIHQGAGHRLLEIRKTRGQPHISGRHRFELRREGVTVFPHLRPEDVRARFDGSQAPERTRVRFGVAGLDQMLHGGLWKGSFNLLVGYPGTGKSVLAHHFVNTGLRSEENCLIVTLGNSAERLLSQARSLGMNWDEDVEADRLRVLQLEPIHLSADTMLNSILEAVSSFRPTRFVFDSLNDLGKVEQPGALNEIVLLLSVMLEASAATSLLLHTSNEMGGGSSDEIYDFSYISSAVIQLSMAETESELRRFASVRKHFGSGHAKELRELTIDEAGVHLDRKATGLTGILRGHALGARTNLAEEVVPVLDQLSALMRDLMEKDDVAESRLKELREARARLGFLDVALREHFGLTRLTEEAEDLIEERLSSE